MIITFSGNTTDFFRDAFYNSSTSGFDVTVVSTSATQIVVRNDSTGFTTTFTGTGLSGSPNFSGTLTGMTTVDSASRPVVAFSQLSWTFSAFVSALADAIDNDDSSGLNALLALQPITFNGQGANAPADLGFYGVNTSATLIGTGFGDTLGGANGNDSIAPGSAQAGSGEVVLGTTGNDTINFAGHGANAWADLYYPGLTSGIAVTINGPANTASVVKGTLGTDTILNVQGPLQADGLTVGGTSRADSFTVNGGTGSWLGLAGGGGNDTMTITLNDTVRLIFGWSTDGNATSGIVANLATGTVSDDGFGGTDTLRITDAGGTLEILATDFNDSITGSAADERFILGAGTDLVTGGGGYDAVRYDRSDVTTGITANLETGVIEGNWGTQSFAHFVTDIDAVMGSHTGNDMISGTAADETFYGYGGNDSLFGLDGQDRLFGDTGNDLLDPGDSTGFDIVDAGAGTDTIDAGSMATGALLVQHAGLATTAAQTVTVDGAADTASIVKAGQGTTTLLSPNAAMLAGGLAITGSNLADSFAVTAVDDGEIELIGGQGNDSFVLGASASGTVKLNFRYDALGAQATQGLVLNLAAGTVSNDGFGGRDTVTGAGSQSFVEVQGTGLADTMTGSAFADAFLTSGGNDTINGGAGIDAISYTQSEMSAGIRANLETGRVTGAWNGAAFTQAVASIEILSGTESHGDVMAGSLASETFSGLGGDDRLYGDGFLVGLAATEARQVYRLYQATLGRAPDGAGLTGWTQGLAEGTLTLTQAVAGFTGSAEFQATYGALDDTGFITLLYNNVLGRTPAVAEVNAWLASLAGGNTREGVVLGFSESTEFKTNTNAAAQAFADGQTPSLWADDVFRLYQATLGRAPDLAGFLGWADTLGSGRAFSAVVTGFVASQEFQNTYGALDDTGFITLLYNNVLGRSPAAAEVNAWLANMAGGASREAVVEGFAQSQEFINGTAGALKTWVRAQGWHDELNGGAGSNVLAGGILADRFVFDTTDGGSHTVLDLEAWDLMAFQNFGYASAADARSHMTQSGADVVFSDQGVTVTLEHVTLAQIADDMIQV